MFYSDTARFGEWNISSDMDCVKYGQDESEKLCSDDVVDISIERMIAHPKYGDINLPSLQNDIALIRTAKKVPFSGTLETKLLQIVSFYFTVESFRIHNPHLFESGQIS